MEVLEPMGGCRVVVADGKVVVVGQPPEVIKSLARAGLRRIDILVLTDSREAGGVLLNNLEFPLYHFLFISNGLAEGRKLGLVGSRVQVDEVMDLLRLTLLGPNREELEGWQTEGALREEWLNAREFFALKNADGEMLQVRDFFEVHHVEDGPAEFGAVSVERVGPDRFTVSAGGETCDVEFVQDGEVLPPYPLNPDQTPSAPIGFGLEILGGASGFSTEQASTGMLIAHHGGYILIDCIPFLDHHLEARGISRNEVRSLLLTHLHDDHCSMFPLMLCADRVEVISTREIFEMAMVKLARGLGWEVERVARCFTFVELRPGAPLDYYGLRLVAHVTVHSIPTIGVTVHCSNLGRDYRMCIVGDNQSFGEIAEMRRAGLLREDTEAHLHHLYREPFDLLVADGGMGAIHGDPADAIHSEAEQVVFVHVDQLPERFSATFSLACAGKRYSVVDGDPDIHASRAIEHFTANFDVPVPARWMNALLGDKRIVHFNRDDVILKQGSLSRGNVFLVLTGCCDVLYHDGERARRIGTREAGDFIGEMAAVTGVHARNASVVARTPVSLCEFSEETFLAFVHAQNLEGEMRRRWELREDLSGLPVLAEVSTTVIERLARHASRVLVEAGGTYSVAEGDWCILLDGEAEETGVGRTLKRGDEGGTLPLGSAGWQGLTSAAGCQVAVLEAARVEALVDSSPLLSYRLQQFRAAA